MARQAGEVHALTRLYDLLLWIIPVLEKFPRSQKFETLFRSRQRQSEQAQGITLYDIFSSLSV